MKGLVFKELKKTSKRAQKFLKAYKNSEITDIDQAYISASYSKRHIFKFWQDWAYALDGKNLKITTHNSHTFSLAFENHTYVFYVTPNNQYKIRKELKPYVLYD